VSRLLTLERQPRRSTPQDGAILEHLARRDAWSRVRRPSYQLQLLRDLAILLPEGPCRILDIGTGSGLIGEAIAALFPGKSVTGVDVVRRTLPDLRIPFVRFDGSRLPFPDGAFDCALFCNVLHHVCPGDRAGLLREAVRVTGGGPILIKDHMTHGRLDDFRLWLLDFVGNAPRGAMTSAQYLGSQQWEELLDGLDRVAELLPPAAYRRSVWAWCFPNRLEICLRVRPGSV
jgi:SAM-dependent methyltransferase